jgi:hypothetical protein
VGETVAFLVSLLSFSTSDRFNIFRNFTWLRS